MKTMWEEFGITGRKQDLELGDRVEVEWQLSDRPPLEWAEIFQLTSVRRQGPVDWVRAAGPDVLGTAIRWFVPTTMVDDADREVRWRASRANQRMGTSFERVPGPAVASAACVG